MYTSTEAHLLPGILCLSQGTQRGTIALLCLDQPKFAMRWTIIKLLVKTEKLKKLPFHEYLNKVQWSW